jgi:hypothetical protein
MGRQDLQRGDHTFEWECAMIHAEFELKASRVSRQSSRPAWKLGRSIRVASLIGILGTASLTHAFAAPEVWMASFEPVWRAIHGWPANDYMRLFEAGAPWGRAARGVKGFRSV